MRLRPRSQTVRGTHRAARIERFHRDHDGRNQKNDRPRYPHDPARDGLIAERGNSPQSRRELVRRVDNVLREDQKRGQSGIHKVGENQVRNHRPTRRARMTRPHVDDRPPEQQRAEEETGVLHLVPALRAQTEFVESRKMPKDHCENAIAHKANRGLTSAPPTLRNARQRRNGPSPFFIGAMRQSAQQRKHRLAGQDQQRRDHQQQQVLHHVRCNSRLPKASRGDASAMKIAPRPPRKSNKRSVV